MVGVMTFPAKARVTPGGLPHSMDGLTHDLRNVMASLQLCSEMLEQPEVLTAGNEYLAGEVRSVSEAAIGLLRSLGALTENWAGLPVERPLPAQQTGGCVGTVLAEMEGLLRRVAGSGVDLEVECAPCWGRMAMPSNDLARVLLNLVRNASEAMPGGGRIRVTAQMSGGQSFARSEPGLRAADAVIISVQDDGPGVPGELARQIFRSGFSTKACANGGARRAGYAGRGLGLTMARELVEVAGGRLKLAKCARGARFEMEIPLTNVTQSWAMRRRFEREGGRA